jgi:heme-degrading monooxygenase HmoA
MWINLTTLKVDPSNVDKVMGILEEACQNMCQDVPEELRGREAYRLQSAEDPGTIVSLTFWDDQERQVKMMQGEAYMNLIKQQLMPLLIATPERAGFYVLGHTTRENCQAGN